MRLSDSKCACVFSPRVCEPGWSRDLPSKDQTMSPHVTMLKMPRPCALGSANCLLINNPSQGNRLFLHLLHTFNSLRPLLSFLQPSFVIYCAPVSSLKFPYSTVNLRV